jgi:hypothetical protein
MDSTETGTDHTPGPVDIPADTQADAADVLRRRRLLLLLRARRRATTAAGRHYT